MKKKWIVLSLALIILTVLISISSVLAQEEETLPENKGIISSIWDRVLYFGALEFLGVSSDLMIAAFIRILVWILIFTIFFAVLMAMKSGKWGFKWLEKTQAIVVAIVLATIAAIGIPVSVLLAITAGWATAISLILLGLPVVGLGLLMITWPGKDDQGRSRETRGTLFLKVVMGLLLLWILSAMKFHLEVIGI